NVHESETRDRSQFSVRRGTWNFVVIFRPPCRAGRRSIFRRPGHAGIGSSYRSRRSNFSPGQKGATNSHFGAVFLALGAPCDGSINVVRFRARPPTCACCDVHPERCFGSLTASRSADGGREKSFARIRFNKDLTRHQESLGMIKRIASFAIAAAACLLAGWSCSSTSGNNPGPSSGGTGATSGSGGSGNAGTGGFNTGGTGGVTSPCAPGLASCNGVCTDTMTDFANCGACGMACGAGQTCTG